MMRLVQILSLAREGEIEEQRRLLPALPAFEEAFSAFARGTLFPTDHGQVAVEDLLPGDRIRTVDHGLLPLLWKGSTLIVPNVRSQDPMMGRLTRIAADALGEARPMPDLILGPRGRIVHRAPGLRALTGSDEVLVHAREFVDGVNIVALSPAAPVQTFHLGFEAHVRLAVHGLDCESFHPGKGGPAGLPLETLALFLSCFPHIRTLASFGEPMMPRLGREEAGLLDVA